MAKLPGLLHKSRHSIRRYLARVFYVAVAAAIAHTINTTRQLAARYSKRVMAPSPSVPVPGNRACLSIFTQRSLDVYRLDFCRHSYLSSRRIWRIEVEEFHTKFAKALFISTRSSLSHSPKSLPMRASLCTQFQTFLALVCNGSRGPNRRRSARYAR